MINVRVLSSVSSFGNSVAVAGMLMSRDSGRGSEHNQRKKIKRENDQ